MFVTNVSVSLTMHNLSEPIPTYKSGDMGTDKILERKPHVTHLLKTPTTTHNIQHDTFGQVGFATKFCKVENMFFSSKKINFFIGNWVWKVLTQFF
jgi:hypothetical protein